MIVGSSRKPEKRPWTVRVSPGEKGRHNHPFLVYRDGHVRAKRLSADIRKHIQELSPTGMQPTFIMTSIKQTFSGFLASMNQIYNVRQSIRREEMEVGLPFNTVFIWPQSRITWFGQTWIVKRN